MIEMNDDGEYLGSFEPSEDMKAGEFRDLKKKMDELEGIDIVNESSSLCLDFYRDKGEA